jgi:hypothetical protein
VRCAENQEERLLFVLCPYEKRVLATPALARLYGPCGGVRHHHWRRVSRPVYFGGRKGQPIRQRPQFVSSLVFGRKTVSFTRAQAGLTIIGAGFPRTGTKSLEAALQGLGHRIYDLTAAYEHGHGDRWVQAAREWQDTGESPTAQALVTELEALGYT